MLLVSCPKAARKYFQSVARNGWRCASIGFTTPSVSRDGPIPSDFLSPRQEALTLVHKVAKFIPAAFSLKPDSESTRYVELWDRILSRVRQDLAAEHVRPTKIVVCPLDELAGSQDLVMALLTDPLSSDETSNRNLKDRWKSCEQEVLRISYGPHSKLIKEPASLALPSAYLTQFSTPIEIIELRRPPSNGAKPLSISQILDHSTVSEADIAILICNPLVTSLSTIPAHLPSDTILVLSAGVPQLELDEILKQSHLYASSKSLQLLAVEPRRAANAIQAFQGEPNSVVAIQRYQDNILGSHISQVTNALRTRLSNSVARTELALHRIDDALYKCHNYLRNLKNHLDAAFLDSSALRDRIEEYTARAERDVFQHSGHLVGNKIVAAVEHARQDLGQTMNHLTWWRLIWKVDEISTFVAAAIQTAWCHDLELELILQTGKLSALQRETSTSTFELLSKHPVIQSAILRNQVLQLQASPTYQLSHKCLTKPIQFRRDQIIKYPTARLHIAGQRAVFGMGAGVTTGVGIGWIGWLGWLLGSGGGIFGSLGMEPSTAIGVGVLVALAGIRQGIGSWEKAKYRWWQDWRRVGDGLERDLKNALDRTMRQQVAVVAITACDSISVLVNKQEQEIAEARRQLDDFQNSLDRITAKLSPNTTN